MVIRSTLRYLESDYVKIIQNMIDFQIILINTKSEDSGQKNFKKRRR